LKPELEFSLLTKNILSGKSWQIENVEPLLSFLYNFWWRVDFEGLENFPAEGPALIVGNVGGLLPWPAFMFIYALAHSGTINRPVHTLMSLDWTDDSRLSEALTRSGFEPWSQERLEQLLSAGEVALVFPEGLDGLTKPFSARNRLRDFDPEMIASALSLNIPLIPLVSLGCDTATPVLSNASSLAKALNLPALPLTPFFPWLPFPYSLVASLPIKWRMRLLEPVSAPAAGYFMSSEKSDTEHMTDLLQGTIQAELNRLIRIFAHSL
jgi:1-acyl-sn-glycerol-3-phosphate acyltransferase